MKDKEYLFELEFTVRDYEVDLQGIVNNAHYQHYLEHARHQFLLTRGLSFSELHNEGLDLIVTRVEIDYKFPLKSGEHFVVKLNIAREGNVRLIFDQDIFRVPDMKHVVAARVTGVATRNGRPVNPQIVMEKLKL